MKNVVFNPLKSHPQSHGAAIQQYKQNLKNNNQIANLFLFFVDDIQQLAHVLISTVKEVFTNYYY